MSRLSVGGYRHRQPAARQKKHHIILMSISIVWRQSWEMQAQILIMTRFLRGSSHILLLESQHRKSMTKSSRNGTGTTSTRTRALRACCCTSTTAFRIHMNVMLSTRPYNSCWASLLIFRLACNMSLPLKSPPKSRCVSEHPDTYAPRGWAPFKESRLWFPNLQIS